MRLRHRLLRGIFACYRFWRRVKKRTIKLMVEDNASPEQIAGGCALGMFVAMTPLWGAQMIIAGLVAGLIRVNRLAAVTFVWASNPVCYLLQFRIGNAMLRAVDMGMGDALRQEFTWQNLVPKLGDLFVPVFLGGIPVGLVLGALTYAASLVVVRRIKRTSPALLPAEESAPEIVIPADIETRGDSADDDSQEG